MSNKTNLPDDKDAERGDKGGFTGKRRAVILGVAAVALITLLIVATTLMSGLTGTGTGEDDGNAQQAAIEEPAEGNAGGAANDAGSDAAKETTDGQEEACQHDWTITYKTVHHDAVTHTENVEPVYGEQTTYHTVCNECKQVIDGKADEHIRETGHSGYSTSVPITDEVVVSEGYTKEVTDTPAYDETVPDKIVCTLCGAERPVTDSESST